ncbi:MAG: hypothetical protein GY765_31980 [bacterium]|nr:hypothetical protein [bacterium]
MEQRILKAPQYLGQSKKPNYFWLGILMTLFYTSVGLFFIYRKTKETNRVPLVKAQGLIRVKGNRSSFLRKVNLTKYHILRPPIPEMPVMTYMNFCGVMVYEIRGKYLDKKFKNLEPTEALWVQFKIADAMKKDTFVFGQYVIDSQDDWTKSIDAIIKKWRKDGKTLVQITESDLAWPGDPDHHYVWKKDKDSGEFKFVKIPLS